MPTRLWGDAQRARYARFPDVIDEDDITRCFHLDDHDQAIIMELRGAHNRLGFASPSRAVNSGLCANQIPNRTFAMPYVSRSFLSHARSGSADATLTELRRRVRKGPRIPMSVRPRPTDGDSNLDHAVLHVDEHGLDRGSWA